MSKREVSQSMYDSFKSLTDRIHSVISSMVIANTAGAASVQARGVSIYFPLSVIDQSYPKTLFAQESRWLEFLEWVIA